MVLVSWATGRSHFILILTTLGGCSLHSPIRVLVVVLILLVVLSFLGLLDSRSSGSLFLPFLEAPFGPAKNRSSRGRRDVAKLPKLLPVNLSRRLTLSSNTLEIKAHNLSLTLVFSMHRYAMTRCSVWLGVSPTDFTGSVVFSCFLDGGMIVV